MFIVEVINLVLYIYDISDYMPIRIMLYFIYFNNDEGARSGLSVTTHTHRATLSCALWRDSGACPRGTRAPQEIAQAAGV